MRAWLLATRGFERWARRERIARSALVEAVDEIRSGLVDARLGAGLIKKRVARPGQGKSGGMRTLLACNFRDRWVFLYGFAKNERENIDERELDALKQLAATLLKMDASLIEEAILEGRLVEISDGKSSTS